MLADTSRHEARVRAILMGSLNRRWSTSAK